MTNSDNLMARRAVLTGLGLGAAAIATMPAKAAAVDSSEGGEIWSSEYWTKKGDIPLWMFRKRIGAPRPGEAARPVVFFVHGSSVTSRVFDLNVPGKGEYSVMNEFARYGSIAGPWTTRITENPVARRAIPISPAVSRI